MQHFAVTTWEPGCAVEPTRNNQETRLLSNLLTQKPFPVLDTGWDDRDQMAIFLRVLCLPHLWGTYKHLNRI